MNSKSALYLTAAALGIFAYIIFFERNTLDTEERVERAGKLFPDFDAGKVASVEILRSNDVIRAQRANGQWRLVRPDYPAQSTAIENWLTLLDSLNRRNFISAAELLAQPGGLAAFGLDAPQATVTVQLARNILRFHVGAKTVVGEKLYLQQVGSDGVLVTDSTLLDRMPESSDDWRDPTFVKLVGLKYDRVHARVNAREGAREFAVERDQPDKPWRLTLPRAARADNDRLHQLLQRLQTARVNRFITYTPGGDLEPYGLQTPEVTLTFSQGTNTVLTVAFGKSPTNDPARVYARRSNYPASIVTVPNQVVDLLRAPYTDFLDRRLIEFTPATVERIEAHAAETFALQRQTNDAWRIVEPFKAPADPALVQGFFERLNSLQIADVVKEVVDALALPGYGLSPPAREYVLKTADSAESTNRPPIRIEFGTNHAGKVFVRRSDESSVYTMPTEDADSLPQAAFELRDRRIWRFTTNQVTGATIELNGRTFKLRRSGNGNWAIAEGSQGMINPFALEEAMYRFGQLRSRHWDACGKINSDKFGFGNPPHKISIEVNDGDKPRTVTVEFGKQSLSGGPYALVDLEGGRTVFEFPFDAFNAYSEVVRSLAVTVGAAR